MRFNVFVVILVLQAYISMGKQEFLSQEENKSAPQVLLEREMSGPDIKGLPVGKSNDVGGGWGDFRACPDGSYAHGIKYILTDDKKRIKTLSPLCKYPNDKGRVFVDAEWDFKEKTYQLKSCTGNSDTNDNYITEIYSFTSVDTHELVGLGIKCVITVSNYIGRITTENMETTKTLEIFRDENFIKQKGLSIMYTSYKPADDLWAVCGLRDKTRNSDNILSGAGVWFCNPPVIRGFRLP